MFAFGFRASRLPRFWSLAITSPFAPDRSARSTKNQRPRNPQEARGHRRKAPFWTLCRYIAKPPAHPRSASSGDAGRRQAWVVQSRRQVVKSAPATSRYLLGKSKTHPPAFTQAATVATLCSADCPNRISVKKIKAWRRTSSAQDQVNWPSIDIRNIRRPRQ